MKKRILPDTRFEEATRLQRSAVTIWWTAFVIAVLLGLLAAWLAYAWRDPMAFVAAVLSVVCWVVGRSAFFFMVRR